MPDDHLTPKLLLEKCGSVIADIFGIPVNLFLEIMPNSSNELILAIWIQWFEINDGMKRYDQSENWYIEKGYDLKSAVFNKDNEFW